MRIKSLRVSKSPDKETDEWEYSASISVSGMKEEKEADELLDAFKRAVQKRGGQTTLTGEEGV